MTTAKPAIQTFGLGKSFGEVRALIELDLVVHRGEVFGFLGPNGAGKTTLIRLLLDFIRPSTGQAEVLGLDVRQDAFRLRRMVGNLPGDFYVYPQLGVDAFLELCSGGRPDGMKRARALADRFGLDLKRKVGTLSSGNRQKIGLVQSFMHDPELVILDEPTAGLDPLVREEFYRLVEEEKSRAKTIFMSSHVLPEVERICDRVGIVREGRLIAVEEVESLKRHKRRRMDVTFSNEVDPARFEALARNGVEVLATGPTSVELSVPEGGVDAIVKVLAEFRVADLVYPEATLEEAFMSLYNGVEPAGGAR